MTPYEPVIAVTVLVVYVLAWCWAVWTRSQWFQ